MEYTVSVDDEQNRFLLHMLNDRKFWPSGVPPATMEDLLKWAVDDYVDYYESYLRTNKKGDNENDRRLHCC